MVTANIQSTPRQQVVIYPFKKRYNYSSEADLLDTTMQEITNSVLEVSYSKSKASPSGTFYIILAPTKKWNYMVKAGDWLTIHQSQINLDPSTTEGLLCFGSVDRVSRTYNIDDDGVETVRYKIEGRDFGKIFEETKFYFNPYLFRDKRTEGEVSTVTSTQATTLLGHPAKLFLQYFNLYFGTGKIPVKVPGFEQSLNQVKVPPKVLRIFGSRTSNSLSDVVRIKIGDKVMYLSEVENILNSPDLCDFDNNNISLKSLFPEGFSYSVPLDLVTNGSIWDILKTLANLSMNELYTSMEYYPAEDKVVPTIIFRKIPFRREVYTKLDNIVVSDTRIKDEDLGFSDQFRINYIQLDTSTNVSDSWQAQASSTGISNAGVTYTTPSGETRVGVPYVDVSSIKRYGYRPHFESTIFCQKPGTNFDGAVNPYLELYQQWFEELVAIWSNAERYEEGTIVVKGFSRIETKNSKSGKESIITDALSVGYNAYIPEQQKLFHIEGFTKTWRAPGALDIVLTLVRGVHYTGKGDYKYLDEVKTESYTKKVSHNIVKPRRR